MTTISQAPSGFTPRKSQRAKNRKWWNLPNPNPHEVFPYFLEQMFGTEQPASGQNANMTGFLANYVRLGKKDPEQIMQKAIPQNRFRCSASWRNPSQYAIGWFGSLPCETWPNRSFLHAGTSFGRLNNLVGEYDDFGIPTYSPLFTYAGKRNIFDVLDEQHVSWKVYSDMGAYGAGKALGPGSLRVSLTSWQFWDYRSKT